ncbi:universal stress protein [Streptomyces sp. NPDC087844]|uniref:universal stress protein n=1 Tax=Streptomyces sp. NPDC087844 TaxID=3365805 RepID=UPI0038001D0C
MTTGQVTVGVDGSLVAVRALDRAADEAALRATTLEVVYAVPDLDEAGPILASAVSRVHVRHPGLPVVAVPVEGHSAAVLAEHGRDSVLTVVGCRNMGGFAGTLFGSVSSRLAAHAHGPLLVVRGDSPGHSYGEVLLVLDDETDAIAAIDATDAIDATPAAYAFQEAALRGARLRFLRFSAHRHPVAGLVPHGGTGPAAPHPANPEESAVVRERRTRVHRVCTEIRSAATRTTRELLDATRTADLVVIARRPEPGGHGRRPGPAARTLLHRAHCPVLIVPAGPDGAGGSYA